jgi:hypothetical protein
MERYAVLDGLSSTAGCGSCGGCSMEMNLIRLLKNNKDKELYNFMLSEQFRASYLSDNIPV